MKEYNPDPAVKKVRYIVSIIYLLVIAFLVIGSYINQQKVTEDDINTEEGVIWPEAN